MNNVIYIEIIKQLAKCGVLYVYTCPYSPKGLRGFILETQKISKVSKLKI